MLAGKCVALCLTGGIAAYKSAEIASRLKKLHADVVCVMTRNAKEFITPLTMETLTGNPVVSDMFERPATWEVEHIALARRAGLFLIAPATANIIAKLAHGIADDFLTTTVLATRSPILIAPAMNTGMYENPATQENIQTLKSRGVSFVGPGFGRLADPQSFGIGRLTEIDEIVDKAVSILLPNHDMNGMHVMVTAGASREMIDPVRFISNRSSGRMGIALAEAARDRGAEVTLLCGEVTVPLPFGVEIVRYMSTLDLFDSATRLSPAMDIIVQAAAPADYRAQYTEDTKIKKDGDSPLTITFVQNPDVAAALGKTKKNGQILIGFAAETSNLIDNAQTKLTKKNCDIIVANNVMQKGAGFDTDTNIVSIVTANGVEDLPIMPKRALADKIFNLALKIRG